MLSSGAAVQASKSAGHALGAGLIHESKSKKEHLKTLVDQLVEERLQSVLPRFEDALTRAGIRCQLLEGALARVEGQLGDVRQDVASLRSAVGARCDYNDDYDALRQRVQDLDDITSQLKAHVSELQDSQVLRDCQQQVADIEVDFTSPRPAKDGIAGTVEDQVGGQFQDGLRRTDLQKKLRKLSGALLACKPEVDTPRREQQSIEETFNEQVRRQSQLARAPLLPVPEQSSTDEYDWGGSDTDTVTLFVCSSTANSTPDSEPCWVSPKVSSGSE